MHLAQEHGTVPRVLCMSYVCAEEGDLRLADGLTAADGSAQYGRLEMYRGGGWGTVCNADSRETALGREFSLNLTDASAAVACRQLGFSNGVSTSAPTAFFIRNQMV